MTGRALALLGLTLLAGCGPSAARVVALDAAIGQSEAELTRELGPPATIRLAGETRLLTYDRADPLDPFEPDASASPVVDAVGSAADYPPEATLGRCATTFTVTAGRVTAWRTRGNAC